jgi:predicted Zn finger-like uncharacterized protein
MPEIVTCPSCNKQLRVPDTLIGKNVKCPQCGTTFVGGVASAEPAMAEPAFDRGGEGPSRPRYRDERGYDDDYDRGPGRGRRGDYVSHRGGAVLTMGILSIVLAGLLGLILGIIAWSMGASDLRKIREGIMDPAGEGSTKGGMICGIIGTIISILAFCFVVFFLSAIMRDMPR